MLATLALALITTASAGSDGKFVWSNGNDAIRRSVAMSYVNTDELWNWNLYSSDDTDFEGTLLLDPDSGYMYGQGLGATTSWAFAGRCSDTGDSWECDIVGTGLDGDGCTELQTTAVLRGGTEGFDGELTIGKYAFKVEWGGSTVGFSEAGLALHASSQDDGEVDDTGTMYGFYDTDGGTLHLSWWNDRLCDGFVIHQDAECSTNKSGRTKCEGDADLWLGSRSAATTVSFWGYDNMTTVKGYTSTTMPHFDGI